MNVTRQDDKLGALEDELCVFDKGAHDDQVDAVAYAARLLPIISGHVGGVPVKIEVMVVDIRQDKVRLGIEAPAALFVDRQEVFDRRKHS